MNKRKFTNNSFYFYDPINKDFKHVETEANSLTQSINTNQITPTLPPLIDIALLNQRLDIYKKILKSPTKEKKLKRYKLDEEQRIGKCKVVGYDVSLSLGSAISSYAYHLGHIHLITKYILLAQEEQDIKNSEIDKPLSKDKQEQANFRLLEFLIDDLQPFTLLKNKKFKAFCNFLYSNYRVPCISDNDAKIIKAFQELQIANISCSIYTIHLAVSDGLKINLRQELLKKAKALNLFLVHHNKYQNHFLQIQKILQPTKDTLAPIQDIDNRWNFTYKDDNKEIHKDGNNFDTLYLITEEWIRVEELTFILYSFFQATKFISGSTYSILSIFYPMIEGLFKYMRNFQHFTHQSVIQIRNTILKLMEKHWLNPQDFGLLVSLIDSHFKSLSFVSFLKREYIFSIVYNFIEPQRETQSLQISDNSMSPMLQFFKNCGYETNSVEKSELDIYMKLPILSPIEANDPILCSTLAERLFSSAGNILTEKCNHLDPTTVSDLLFLHLILDLNKTIASLRNVKNFGNDLLS
ncbi:20268_t:CDS:2 [Funneliformis geosporum]|nr:20268_t:CDS:2 [Funneliformis geosporum]